MGVTPRGQVSKEQVSLEKRLRDKGTALLVLVTIIAAVVLLGIALPLNPWAKATQEYWAFIGIAATTLGAAIGLWFVWVKFIRARDFAAKLDLTLTAGKVFLSDAEGNLHWFDVKLENKGTVTIYYQISVIPILHKDGISTRGTQLASLVPTNNNAKPNVDVGATSYEHYVTTIPCRDAQAVTFQVVVSQDDRTETWWSHLTASNRKEEAKS